MAAPLGFLDSHDHTTCPAKLALEVMQGRWKIPVLRELAEGTQRFSELSRSLRGVSPKVLSSTLRELEANGVVIRTVVQSMPLKVDYQLSPRGRALIPLLESLHAWGLPDRGPDV
ncbi:helix-turn-helix transcriptional regulator [Synechococcus sp. BSF8S]|uniref:winged helix-turn-helix transcriptional regulator n=1 Tax=Synechococcales TaxID=1890424 RepID=UPI0016246DCF|nr:MULTISPECIES: helix-turn-helix domain-containing protein [unclassified Synechococcus]MBC1260464.1 helix-turn-helix transcriptional regulator [Synechococcus sp. BSF8S]MBC1263835.1 helix-turn-helix transcriptional regulator [Synechococcus sp. BSA11S]